MDKITVIISHYSPVENQGYYQGILMDNVRIISSQISRDNLEIIICDDGSKWSSSLTSNNGIYILKNIQDTSNKFLKNLNCDLYLRYPSGRYYKNSLLKNTAINMAKFENILILDDDTMLNKNAIKKYLKYLKDYDYVKGRVVKYWKIPHTYFSNEVQGTNYAIKKYLYIKTGGFSEYLYDDSWGEDDEINWLIYKTIKYESKNNNNNGGCYAGDIIGKDIESGRWKIGDKMGNPDERWENFRQNFINIHGLSPNNNDSRKKWKWLTIPSLSAFIYEIFYLSIRIFFATINFKFKKGIPKIVKKVIINLYQFLPVFIKNWYRRKIRLKNFAKSLMKL
tara:strand:- start:459 stop:1469 length:1011 start_codon:yes stop_codon:yes gene_type:complete